MASETSLLRRTLALWRAHQKILLSIVAVVAIPSTIIGNWAGGDSSLSAYLAVATTAMNLALIWTVIRLQRSRIVKLREAYYQGTAAMVRFFLVAVALAIQFIPAAIGFTVYILGTTGSTVTVGSGEKLLLGVVAIVLALPTVYWFVRYVLSIYVVVEDDLRPLAALRRSREVVRGHFWQVLRGLVALVLVLVAILVVPSFGVALIGHGAASQVVVTLFQLAVSLFGLPFIHIYMYELYRGLADEKA